VAIVSKVGRRGQITLPSVIRRLLQVDEGDRIAFVDRDGAIVLQRLPATLREQRGSVPVSGEQDFEAVRAAMRATRAQRDADDTANG
jgi:AbrB family looped-hinge helix DNA binding protein